MSRRKVPILLETAEARDPCPSTGSRTTSAFAAAWPASSVTVPESIEAEAERESIDGSARAKSGASTRRGLFTSILPESSGRWIVVDARFR